MPEANQGAMVQTNVFPEVFEILAKTAQALHVPNAPSQRAGGRTSSYGIAGILENNLRQAWVEAILNHFKIQSAQEETYFGSGRRNDFTLLIPGGRIFNEFKISAVPMGKLSRISDDAMKLRQAKPPCGLLILALSATDELQTDEKVGGKANDGGVKWSFAFKKTIATQGLGELMGENLWCARLYWFVKTM